MPALLLKLSILCIYHSDLYKSVQWKNTYSQMPLQRGLIYHNITYDTAITVAESDWDIRITTDTPYLELCVSIVKIWEKIDRVIRVQHCTSIPS